MFIGLVGVATAMMTLATPQGVRAGRAGVDSITSIAMTVSDVRRAAAFYEDVLTFAIVSDVTAAGTSWPRRTVTLALGDEVIELTEYVGHRARPIPGDARSNDRWFQHIAIVVSDMTRAYARLRAHDVTPTSTGPQQLPLSNRAAGGIVAYYFKDPDGHPLELLQFPADKGLAKWHEHDDRVFLGIDHTAIVVDRSAASLKFYVERLGLHVAGRSENAGVEQEQLSRVAGAHLLITTLRASHGPGIELLQYVEPRDGRVYPRDERPEDVVHEQTIVSASDARAVIQRMKAAGVRIEPLPASGHGTATNQPAATWRLRDPDGHPVEIDQQ